MRALAFSAAVFLAATASAQTAAWQHVATTTDALVDVDRSSLKLRDGQRQGWFRLVYLQPQQVNQKPYDVAMLLMLADCAHGEIGLLQGMYYRGDAAVDSYQVARSELELSEPAPETAAVAMVKALCK